MKKLKGGRVEFGQIENLCHKPREYLEEEHPGGGKSMCRRPEAGVCGQVKGIARGQ